MTPKEFKAGTLDRELSVTETEELPVISPPVDEL
jgi:hypothetical protein